MAYGHLIDNSRVFGAVGGPSSSADVNALEDELRFLLGVFDDLHEGIAAYDQLVTDAGGAPTNVAIFTVFPGMDRTGTNIFDVAGTAASGAAILGTSICTDGTRIYYAGGAGTDTVVAASPADGSELWEVVIANSPTDVCVDQDYVWIAEAGGAGTLTRGIKSTGVGLGVAIPAIPETWIKHIASNGATVACANSTTGTTFVTTVDVATMTQIGQVNCGGGALTCICVDKDSAYVADNNAASCNVYKVNLAVPAVTWSTASTQNNVPNNICTDGDFIYVSCSDVGGVNFIVLDCATGALVREIRIGGAENLDGVCCDDQNIYVSNATSNDVYVLTKHPAGIMAAAAGQVVEIIATTRDVRCCDGVSIISYQPTTGNFTRDRIGRPPTRFFMTNSADPHLRPFHHDAIPCG